MAVAITVAGMYRDKGFQQCRVMAENLASVREDVEVTSLPMVESEYEEYRVATGRELGGAACAHSEGALVFYNGTNYVGGAAAFVQWMADQYDYEDKTPAAEYQQLADREYDEHLTSLGHQFAFLDFAIGDEGGDAERVVFELYSDVCPKTCENFRALCTGERGSADTGGEAGQGQVKLSYEGSPIHRVLKGGFIQGGDIVSGAGDGGHSIYGAEFPDESFGVPHSSAGVLAMANDGVHTNASQYYITLNPLSWMDAKAVAFGRVISGMRTVRRIAALETRNERPVQSVKVAACGQLVPKGSGGGGGEEEKE